MELTEAIRNIETQRVKDILIQDPACIRGEHLFAAAEVGDLELLRYLVEYSRISLNERDALNRTALHYCTASDSAVCYEYLVCKCGLSPFEGDARGETPWEMAVSSGADKICRWMKNHYGDIGDYYKNPIRTGMYPDPSIVRVGEDYYMVNSSFIFFPCIPVSHSRDLIHWDVIGYAITDLAYANLEGLEGGRGYWAPDISWYDGKFWITATYRLNDDPPVYRRQIVVSSEKPEGPYSAPAYIEEDGIDPSLFNDEDGRRYMLLNRGARILELSRDGTRQISEAQLLYYGDYKRAPEGPHLFRKDGYYYLLLAEGGTGTGHRVTIARSRELFGTYEPCPHNPIMIQQDPEAVLQRCGHGDLVETADGRWYMVYLCGRMLSGKYSILGRETALDPVEWTADGWPVVNHGRGPSTLQRKPFPKAAPFRVEKNHRHLSLAGLPMEFMTPRPAPEGTIQVTETDQGYAWKIRGSRAQLTCTDARSIVVRRQSDFRFRADVELLLDEKPQDGQMAGMVGYYDENTFLMFGITSKNHTVRPFLWEHIGEEDHILYAEALPKVIGIPFQLSMETRGLERKFLLGDRMLFESSNVYYLCDEGLQKGKRFTGAMVGMAVYEGEAGKSWTAKFRNFEYRGEADL